MGHPSLTLHPLKCPHLPVDRGCASMQATQTDSRWWLRAACVSSWRASKVNSETRRQCSMLPACFHADRVTRHSQLLKLSRVTDFWSVHTSLRRRCDSAIDWVESRRCRRWEFAMKRLFHSTQRTQRSATDATTASILAFRPLRQLRSLHPFARCFGRKPVLSEHDTRTCMGCGTPCYTAVLTSVLFRFHKELEINFSYTTNTTTALFGKVAGKRFYRRKQIRL